MLLRALLVLLIVLNGGVALWWATRGEDADAAPVAQPQGVARLQLLRESPGKTAARPLASSQDAQRAPPTTTSVTTASARPPDGAAAATAEAPAAATTAAEPPSATRCFAFGPFENAEQAAQAHAQLRSKVLRARERGTTPSTRGWRVTMAVAGDRAAAQAVAAKISAAGFDDLFVAADGEAGSRIALGRYGSEQAARKRESALRAAGFVDARAEPLGESAPARFWIDIAAGAGFQTAAARRIVGAARADPIDCAKLP